MNVQTKTKAKRYLIYALIIFASHIFQNTLCIFPELFSVRPILLISATVCIAMFEGEIVGAGAGLFAGLLWDTVTVTADGYNALYLTVACAVCGVLLRILMRNNIVTFTMMNSAITVIYVLTYILFFISVRGIGGEGYLFLRYYLPMIIYTLILTPLWYILIRTVYRKYSFDYTEY